MILAGAGWLQKPPGSWGAGKAEGTRGYLSGYKPEEED